VGFEPIGVVAVLKVSADVLLEESDVGGGGPGDLIQEVALRESVVRGRLQVHVGQELEVIVVKGSWSLIEERT
jgi:hypothetical protein